MKREGLRSIIFCLRSDICQIVTLAGEPPWLLPIFQFNFIVLYDHNSAIHNSSIRVDKLISYHNLSWMTPHRFYQKGTDFVIFLPARPDQLDNLKSDSSV